MLDTCDSAPLRLGDSLAATSPLADNASQRIFHRHMVTFLQNTRASISLSKGIKLQSEIPGTIHLFARQMSLALFTVFHDPSMTFFSSWFKLWPFNGCKADSQEDVSSQGERRCKVLTTRFDQRKLKRTGFKARFGQSEYSTWQGGRRGFCPDCLFTFAFFLTL